MRKYLFYIMGVMACCVVIADFSHAKFIEFNDKDYTWDYIRDRKGIKQYVSETPGSRFRTFKAETVMEQPIEVLLEVLLDVDGFASWLPDCIQSKMLKNMGNDRLDGHYLVHVVWDSIWPITNRDFVIEVISQVYYKDDTVIVELITTDDYDIPEAPGTKRLKQFYSRYQFTFIDKKRTHITYSMLVDPDLPLFPRLLVEIQTASIPFKTLKELGERAKEKRFREKAIQELF